MTWCRIPSTHIRPLQPRPPDPIPCPVRPRGAHPAPQPRCRSCWHWRTSGRSPAEAPASPPCEGQSWPRATPDPYTRPARVTPSPHCLVSVLLAANGTLCQHHSILVLPRPRAAPSYPYRLAPPSPCHPSATPSPPHHTQKPSRPCAAASLQHPGPVPPGAGMSLCHAVPMPPHPYVIVPSYPHAAQFTCCRVTV